jgi:hypothetical protein
VTLKDLLAVKKEVTVPRPEIKELVCLPLNDVLKEQTISGSTLTLAARAFDHFFGKLPDEV